MEWRDLGIVLGVRRHGETASIVTLLTRQHGRHAGLVRGGQGRRARGLYQPGNLLAAHWRARLPEHLGSYSCELEDGRAARLLEAPGALAALSAAAAVCERALPEREPHPACFAGFLALLDALEHDHWPEAYVRWELALLAELGFGLDLSGCAAGGDDERLTYVSPRTGRALSEAAGAPYRQRLLPLPGFLVARGTGGAEEVGQGLRLTGHFLDRFVFEPQGRKLPPARCRLAERFPAPRP